jgi:hypothetical protein
MSEREGRSEPQIRVTRTRDAPGRRATVGVGRAGADSVWDWEGDLSEPERAELAELRRTVLELREHVAALEREVAETGRREREAREALGELAAAGAWRRRRVLARLRERALL